jgi:SAM-dependent methyltransferase
LSASIFSSRLRTIVRKALPGPVRQALGQWLNKPVSHGYRQMAATEITPELANGWKDDSIPGKQRHLADTGLAEMRAGRPPRQLTVAAEAILQTGSTDPTIIEIGCASGYYFEALEYLLDRKARYVGLDYSLPLLQLAHRTYPDILFLNGDATRLPFANSSWDIVLSGCVLLHVPDWQIALAETVRITRLWCIFHRTPVCNGPTQLASKLAYGIKVIEWLFSEHEFLDLVRQQGLELVSALPISTGDSIPGLEGAVSSITYVCRKAMAG